MVRLLLGRGCSCCKFGNFSRSGDPFDYSSTPIWGLISGYDASEIRSGTVRWLSRFRGPLAVGNRKRVSRRGSNARLVPFVLCLNCARKVRENRSISDKEFQMISVANPCSTGRPTKIAWLGFRFAPRPRVAVCASCSTTHPSPLESPGPSGN